MIAAAVAGLLGELEDEIADVVEAARGSLVHIRAGGRGAGAGTVWHHNGLIVTNAHVVERGPLAVTLADGRTLQARVLARDSALDLAALAVDASGLPTIELGESSQLQPGQLVLALGHPWGMVGAASAGTVIGVGSQLPDLPRSRREWVAVSLNVRPGNSGGPLLDARGRLVGITNMMSGPEVGVAVPVHVAKAFLRATLGSQTAA